MTTHFKLNKEYAWEVANQLWAKQKMEKGRAELSKITFTDVEGDENQVILHTEKSEDEIALAQALIDLKILFCIYRYS
jgi:hypothetical protein